MQKSTTTVRLSEDTRDKLRNLARTDGVTLDEEVTRLVGLNVSGASGKRWPQPHRVPRNEPGSRWAPASSANMQLGDVVHVDFGVPAGSEPGFVRPAIVVTADPILQARPRTIQVVPVTIHV